MVWPPLARRLASAFGTWRFTNVEHGLTLRHTTGKERRIKRWEHEAVIDAMQQLNRRASGFLDQEFWED
jgi:hypothetical protein